MINPILASPEVVKYVVKRFGLHMSKKLGQNFLIRRDVVDDIVAAAALSPGDAVLEIGPGIGTLTQGLADSGAAVTALELDQRLLPVLSHTLENYGNVHVVHGDVLRTDLWTLMRSTPTFKVCANLPYYITTPIVMGLLEQKLPISCMVIMIQKEVAERMTATPGGKIYGALSVAVQYYTEPEIMFEVPSNAFMPAPAVTSAVIRLTPRKMPPVVVLEESMFFRVVKIAFSQRRKTFANTLKAAGIDKDIVVSLLEKCAIDSTCRGETLSMDKFALVANEMTALKL